MSRRQNSDGEDGFLSRWTRRKQEVREAEQREAILVPAPGELESSSEAVPIADPDSRDVPPDDETRQRWIEEIEAIDIDALDYDSDFAIFMKSWVPGVLRQRALRKLWTTNPALAVLDGLNDYDLDYTDKAMKAGKVVSSYTPGSGYAKLEELVEKVAEAVPDEDGAGEDDMPVFEDNAATTAGSDPELDTAEASPTAVDGSAVVGEQTSDGEPQVKPAGSKTA